MAGKGGLANKIRAGLDESLDTSHIGHNSVDQVDPLAELWLNKTIRQHVREFGAVVGLVLAVFAGFSAYRGALNSVAWLSAIALTLVFLTRVFPTVVVPVWRVWMALAEKLGLVMTTIILSVGWFAAIIPMALGLRLFRIKVMNTTFRQPVKSYWEDRDPKYDDFKLLERQF